jgi:anti-anti-sigma factor
MANLLELRSSQYERRVPVTVFHLTGELNSSNYLDFQGTVLQAVDSGAAYILLDLTELTYISSAGLRAFYSIVRALAAKGENQAEQGGEEVSFKSPYFKLLNPSRNVFHALEVMGFNMLMELHNDLETALASF